MKSGKSPKAQPFSEHLQELRLRVLFVISALFLGSIAGYVLHEWVFRIIRQPLNEKLYYTTPTGGFNAVIKISILFGILVTIPVLIYQIGRFLSPAFRHRFRASRIILFSVCLAVAGVAFAYFLSLPASLHFLANVDTKDLQSLITVNEYLNFVAAYLAGFALLFQLPLILLFINRIKPQRPSKLMGIQRYIIVGSFILAAILTPTPDPMNQLIMALPIILLYQFSVIIIWFVNRREKFHDAEPIPIQPAPAGYDEPVYSDEPATSQLPESPTPEPIPVSEPRLIMDVFRVPQNPTI